MNPRMVLRMAIKAAGLFILVQVLPQVVNEIVHIINWMFAMAHGAGSRSYDWIYRMQSIATMSVLIACGLYLLLGGKWLLNKCVPLGALCEICGHNNTGCAGDRCPECGSKLPSCPEQPASE